MRHEPEGQPAETSPKPTARTQVRRRCDAHRHEIERQVRSFLKAWEGKNLNLAAQPTRLFLEEVRPIVEQLDVIDCARES